MPNKNLRPLIESWQKRAHEHLAQADKTNNEKARSLLLNGAILNINLATELLAISDDIDTSKAQDAVLQNVISDDEQLLIMIKPLLTGKLLT